VNDGTGRVPRLVVGISRSPASWWALAWAVGEARQRGALLLLVHVFCPPVAAPAAVAGPGMPPTSRDLYADRVAYGNALIRTAIYQAVGWMPGDVAMEQQAFSGRPAVELARVARGGDLLVLGSRRRGWLRRLAPGSVARACAIEAPDRLLRVWSLLQASYEQSDWAALPPGSVPALERQLQAIRRELEKAVSPPLAAELRRILPPQDAAPSVGALRTEYAVLLSWSGSLMIEILRALAVASERRPRPERPEVGGDAVRRFENGPYLPVATESADRPPHRCAAVPCPPRYGPAAR